MLLLLPHLLLSPERAKEAAREKAHSMYDTYYVQQ